MVRRRCVVDLLVCVCVCSFLAGSGSHTGWGVIPSRIMAMVEEVVACHR